MKNGQSIENGVTNTEYLERNEGAIKNGQSIENGVTNTEYLERNEGANQEWTIHREWCHQY